ncbi:hypothetical protein ACJX0J_007689, partial [Zea mays]
MTNLFELFCYGLAKEFEYDYSRLFGCGIGSLPFNEWQGGIDRFEKNMFLEKRLSSHFYDIIKMEDYLLETRIFGLLFEEGVSKLTILSPTLEVVLSVF